MYYQVMSYNSETDTLHEYRLVESKKEALCFLRDAENRGCDSIRLFVDGNLPKFLI